MFSRDRVYKYGTVEPHWPPEPPEPRVDPHVKYGLTPPNTSLLSEFLKEERIKAVTKQTIECLKRISRLLDQPRNETTVAEIDFTIAELSLLFYRLNTLRWSNTNEVIAIDLDKQKNKSVIMYIVISPSKAKKKK